mmetsp:Transcript_86730/g.244440  ORF Transcript_86730/g.244440 Transcript_86730/m.244440 type:complete len:209 (+) Transcript_86730:768-1394(+)
MLSTSGSGLPNRSSAWMSRRRSSRGGKNLQRARAGAAPRMAIPRDMLQRGPTGRITGTAILRRCCRPCRGSTPSSRRSPQSSRCWPRTSGPARCCDCGSRLSKCRARAPTRAPPGRILLKMSLLEVFRRTADHHPAESAQPWPVCPAVAEACRMVRRLWALRRRVSMRRSCSAVHIALNISASLHGTSCKGSTGLATRWAPMLAPRTA